MNADRSSACPDSCCSLSHGALSRPQESAWEPELNAAGRPRAVRLAVLGSVCHLSQPQTVTESGHRSTGHLGLSRLELCRWGSQPASVHRVTPGLECTTGAGFSAR
ncbi:hypothetical protein DPEC_G00361830 [Dallia pectoralis]|nr:hypothetical protein DPEC_G00361830 [Dallia pectoralis]